jgi:hypothetical protein
MVGGEASKTPVSHPPFEEGEHGSRAGGVTGDVVALQCGGRPVEVPVNWVTRAAPRAVLAWCILLPSPNLVLDELPPMAAWLSSFQLGAGGCAARGFSLNRRLSGLRWTGRGEGNLLSLASPRSSQGRLYILGAQCKIENGGPATERSYSWIHRFASSTSNN